MTNPIHTVVAEAADGRLPNWARAGSRRRAHMDGVARLMDRWAVARCLGATDRRRWRAVAHLHDALRDVDPASLVGMEEWPPGLRHGPAVASRLEGVGVEDREVLEAIRYHTTGWAGWDDLGRFLYLADFLEPGRGFAPARTAALRARLPEDVDGVLSTVCSWRLHLQLQRGVRLRSESVEFYNSLGERE